MQLEFPKGKLLPIWRFFLRETEIKEEAKQFSVKTFYIWDFHFQYLNGMHYAPETLKMWS